MIQEIVLKNFLSFRDEVRFSFEATNDKFAESTQVVQINEHTRLLRFAIIYGYNASGKSNLLDVFDFLKYFWFVKQDDMENGTNCTPFKLNQVSPTEHSYFELVFYVEKTKYCYQLELDSKIVYFEKLSYYNTTQPIMLFERKFENNSSVISFGTTLKIRQAFKEAITINCLKNMSFFAARNQVNTNLPKIDEAKDWLRNKIMHTVTTTTDLTQYAQDESAENPDLTRYVVDFLHEADFNITDIKTDMINKDVPNDLLTLMLNMDTISMKTKEMLQNDKMIKLPRTTFYHSVENELGGVEKYILSAEYGEESTGTLRTFGLEALLYNVIKNDAFVSIDEIENSIHPKLLEKILFEYLKAQSESQIIVTTHNDGLLDLVDDLIRKDSIWFTEKQKTGVTDLYKLTDFRGVNRLSSIREAYRNKRFGATMG